VRLEFQPIEALPDPDAAPGVGPDLLGIRGPDADLPARTAAGVVELELRARVTVERRHAPGLRRGTWSRAGSSQTIVIDPVTGERLPAALWTPLGRDEAAERSLLAGIDRRLASTGTRPSESAPGPPAAAPSPAP